MEHRAFSLVLRLRHRCGESLVAVLSWADLFEPSGAVLMPGTFPGALRVGSAGLGHVSGGNLGTASGRTGACPGRIPFASTIDHRQSSSALGVIPIVSRKMVVLKGLAVALR